MLYVVSGFDPFNGVPYDGGVPPLNPADDSWSLGDIWVSSSDLTQHWVIDVTRKDDPDDPWYGDEYMDLDIDDTTFRVYEVADMWDIPDYNIMPVNYESANAASNPYSYLPGGPDDPADELLGSGEYNSLDYEDALGYQGGSHFVLAFDLSDYVDDFGSGFYVRLTEECGNDVMVGQVPEPLTLAGLGALGFGVYAARRRRRVS
jgi:hypothetical protein